MMLVIKRGTAKVHHSDGRAFHTPFISLLCEGERQQLLGSFQTRTNTQGPYTTKALPQGTRGRECFAGSISAGAYPQCAAQHLPKKPSHSAGVCGLHSLLVYRQLTQICPEQMRERSQPTLPPILQLLPLLRSGTPRTQEDTSRARLLHYLFQVIGEFVVRVHKEDVLGFEVSVSEFIVMQN